MRHKRLQKSGILCLSFFLGITMLMTGCGRTDNQMQNAENQNAAQTSPDAENVNLISPTSEIVELENGFLPSGMTEITALTNSSPGAVPLPMEKSSSISQTIFSPI